MTKLFSDNPTHATRALQIWQILIGCAHHRQIITYGILADLLGYKGAGTLANMLGHVMFFCKINDLPPLTVIVVNQDTGLPGEGLAVTGIDLNAERERVYQFQWYGIWPPTPEEFSVAFHSQVG